MAKTPLRLAEGACAVGTTQLHFVPPRGRQRCPQLYLPPRLHLPRASSCSLYLTTRDAGTWGPTLQPPKQQENEQGTSRPQGRRTSHLSCIEEDFQQPLGEWRNFLPVTSLRNCALRFRPSANPSAVVWLFDCHKSITFWHVEATGLDLSSGETHEGFTLPP